MCCHCELNFYCKKQRLLLYDADFTTHTNFILEGESVEGAKCRLLASLAIYSSALSLAGETLETRNSGDVIALGLGEGYQEMAQ